MRTYYEIPLSATPQRFTVSLPIEGNTTGQTVNYKMTFQYRNAPLAVAGGCGWTVDLADDAGTPLACGIPLVTGADLLAQFAYLDLGGHLVVLSEGEAYAKPTFENLGTGAHVYWVTVS
jgi:hypothetical protein